MFLMGRFRIISVLLVLVVVLGMSGCTTDANKPEEGEKVLRLALSGEPPSLDPAKAFDEDSLDLVNNLFEGLMRLDEGHQPKPAVAEEVKVSEDGLTYTFTLRQAKWSNGEPVTAHDFEYAWKRVLDPDTAAEPAFLLYFIEGAEAFNTGKGSADQVGVKALDDRTLEVKLARPTPAFLQLTAYPTYFPVPKKELEKNPDLFAEASTLVSNGAFKLAEWKHDSHLKFVRNEHYRDKASVKPDGIHFSIITDSKTVYSLFKTRKLDVVGKGAIPSDLLEEMVKNNEVKLSEGNGISFFRFNVEKEPFTHPKIRKAFALAVDRRLIVEQVLGGVEIPAYGYVAPSVPGDFRKKGGNLIEDGNIEEAKRLLQEGMKEKGWDKLPEVTLMYSNATDKNKKVAEAVQEMIRKNLGVEIVLQAKERKVHLADQKNKNFIMTTSSFLADYNDAYNYLESFQTGHSMNRTNWSNARYDELLKKAAAEQDPVKRDEYLHEAEKILFEEMPIFPLYFYSAAVIEQPGVKGILRHPVGPSDYSKAEK